jgi:hypothetical protein
MHLILSTTSCGIRFPFSSHLIASGCTTSMKNVLRRHVRFCGYPGERDTPNGRLEFSVAVRIIGTLEALDKPSRLCVGDHGDFARFRSLDHGLHALNCTNLKPGILWPLQHF